MLVSNFQVFLLIFSSSPPIFDCLYCLQLKLSWALSAILMMSKFVVSPSLCALSIFPPLARCPFGCQQKQQWTVSLPLCFMTDASNQLLAASLSLRESLLPSRIINYPIPLSPYRYHFIIAYMRSNWSPRIFTIISLLLFPSLPFFLLSSRISLSVSSSRFPLAQFASSDIYQPNLAP